MLRRTTDPGDTADAIIVVVDGTSVEAIAGETVAGILLRTPPHTARIAVVGGGPRAPYCLAGACFDCVALVDGHAVQTCLVGARDGMTIQRQLSRPSVTAAKAGETEEDR